MFRKIMIAALATGVMALSPLSARAVLNTENAQVAARAANVDLLQARQYRLPETRLPGQESIRQLVTVWEITAGTWNGQSLEGLSLVMVKRIADNDSCATTTRCYVSHSASPAQRDALLGAFRAAQSELFGDSASWRLEPAVIRVEHIGGAVIVHLGLVA
jgi:hypothetical protein